MAKSKRGLERKQAREGVRVHHVHQIFGNRGRLLSEAPAAAHGPPPKPAGKSQCVSKPNLVAGLNVQG